MFEGASNFAKGVDNTFLLIFSISLFFLIGITALMIIFIVKYNRKKHPKAEQIKENMKLEIIWTVIPLVLVLIMFYYGYVVYKPLNIVPKDAMEVKVTGRMWNWTFEYANGKVSEELVLPENKPVKLNLYSPDVIHGLYIPAFRIKQDVVPGKNNFLWFIPNTKGTYEILCSAYCGLRHSFMEAKTRVVTDEEFQKWLSEKNPETFANEGLNLIKNNACTGCHSLDGTDLVGPTFKGLFGSKRVVIENGQEKTLTADSTYISNSILDPDKQVVKGFKSGMMRAYSKVLKEEDVTTIIKYFENQSKISK